MLSQVFIDHTVLTKIHPSSAYSIPLNLDVGLSNVAHKDFYSLCSIAIKM
jgi:hypothetical protein